MTLQSTSMFAAATALRQHSAATLNLQDESHGYQRAIIDAGFEGESLRLAVRNVEEEAASLSEPAMRMSLASGVLESFATLQQRVENLGSIGFAETLMGELGALGKALDWACARSIDALCTPLAAPPPKRLDDFGELPIDAIHELNMAQAPPQIRQLGDANPDLYLLEVSEETMVAIIDPDDVVTWPSSVTTFIDGVGSSDEGRWPTTIERSRSIAQATGGVTALWLGYKAPENLTRAVHSAPAEAAGGELARFQRSLGAHFPAAKKIVAGYSYGSVVTGYAAREGLDADELVLVGSPGTGVRHVSQLGFDGPVTAVTNDGDPISFTGGNYFGAHGVDPTAPLFGARPFPTRTKGTHSSYWTDPVFLKGLRTIAQR
ncbi:alpha/beta hydrolase [Corynebacterium casei]|uniref:DUF1023 domain-containing protein n=2 Tax=Corynebacterium casei TaxID=160386 RepID=G7HY44_9CORY|nr:alpha/beta hydrolase [Corynebacterium casei]AHI21135.1 hypothetical protein CCASEI_12925 [Corynebacterium casei LMG S-19264]CCE55109.1 putative uncharacterized protein [Corynebacterium casei UCMA 3821]